MKNVWRVYILPFTDTGLIDWSQEVEVTEDVVMGSLSNIQQSLSNTQFDVGVFRTNSLNLTLNNASGKYSDVGSSHSIFKFKRADCNVRIVWECEEEDGPIAGVAIAGDAWLSEPVTVFEGLISDETFSMQVEDDTVTFTVLGRESLFSRIVALASVLPVSGTSLAHSFYIIMNQSPVYNFMSLVEGLFNPGVALFIDDANGWENEEVSGLLDNLLKISSSVLTFDELGRPNISPRTPTLDVKYQFNGQGASGSENIQLLGNIRNGLARVYNYITWRGTTLVSSDSASISKYGIRKLEISEDSITNDTYRQACLDALRDEFGSPKQEMEIVTPINYDTIALKLLDRVSIDYPIVYLAGSDPLPICGACVCGEAVLPDGLWSFTVSPDDHYKIMGRTIDIKNGLIKFKVREI